MKIQKNENPETLAMLRKIKRFFTNDDDFMSLFTTLLGAADNVAQYVLEKEAPNYSELSIQCKYGLLHLHKILQLVRAILRDEIKDKSEGIIGGFFPTDDSAWESEKDFEKRFVILVKLFYRDLKKEGKI